MTQPSNAHFKVQQFKSPLALFSYEMTLYGLVNSLSGKPVIPFPPEIKSSVYLT